MARISLKKRLERVKEQYLSGLDDYQKDSEVYSEEKLDNREDLFWQQFRFFNWENTPDSIIEGAYFAGWLSGRQQKKQALKRIA